MPVAFTDMMHYIRPIATGVPDVTGERYLAHAAAHFCEETYLWRVTLDEDTTIADEPDYQVLLPGTQKLVDVIDLAIDTTNETLIRANDRLEVVNTDTDRPNRYAIINDDTIRMYPTPDDAYVFKGTMVIKPALDASSIENFLYERHGLTISYYALYLLLRIPAKDWTDPALAEQYRIRFDKEVCHARVRDDRSIQTLVRQRPFA